ncbi:hypothetical protein GCM10020295_25110 [Streptomyces cinereospinus]
MRPWCGLASCRVPVALVRTLSVKIENETVSLHPRGTSGVLVRSGMQPVMSKWGIETVMKEYAGRARRTRVPHTDPSDKSTYDRP